MSEELTEYLRQLREAGQRLRESAAPNEVPRRIDMLRWTPAERAIYDAMQAVEAMPADMLLTQAVLLLGKAQEAVADFVDSQPSRPVEAARG
jgi:hypothetical protein